MLFSMCITTGCYDGNLYVLDSKTGEVHWSFGSCDSGQPIKCSPCVDPLTGHVWFGSHNHHMYAVDIYVSQ